MESNFEAGSFETGSELESQSEYLIQPRGARSSGMRGASARLFRNAGSLLKTAGSSGKGLRGTQAGQSSGRSGLGSRWSRGRPWRRHTWMGRSGFGPISTDGSEFVSSMQSCLQQVVGAWVPQNGAMGPGTRRAIRIFQKKSGMPVTGLLDESTVSALQSACASPAGPEGPPPQSAVPPEAPPEAPAGPEAAAPEGGEAGGEMESEVEQDTAPEQEFQIDTSCEVHFARSFGQAAMTDPNLFGLLPKLPGLYMIYVQGKPWYVGIAETTLHKRFQDRFKTLRDFNLPDSVLAQRQVAWLALDTKNTKCAVGRKEQGSSQPFKKSPGYWAVLKVLEQHLIKKIGTKGLGNKAPLEDVTFDKGGSLQIKRPGVTPLKFDAGNPI
jgi:peptidoglycan hydrolase-like protein with peptidoglycan-binding domain